MTFGLDSRQLQSLHVHLSSCTQSPVNLNYTCSVFV